MSTSPRTCAQNFLPNLTQSLANSRLTLLHLYVPFTFQRIGQRDNSYRLPAARIPLRFAQCPCTQTAIYAAAAAVAVNHPHHINCVNHSSNKCQPALANALIPVNPSSHRVCRHAPKISHTISHNLTQSLVNLSSNAPASLRSIYISKNRTKRQLLQAACSKNPTAIRPVPMHADRDPAPPPLIIPIT